MCNCNNSNPCIPNQTLCAPQVDCTCPVQIKSSCVTMYDGNDLECSGIESGLPLNQTIQLLDAYICEAIDEINASINLINVGTGEDIYAGIDGIGRRKIKRINTDSNILTIIPNTDDITFGIDEEALNTFVEANQKTYSVDNVGTGVEVYKDSTVVGDNTQFNFRTFTSSNNSISIDETSEEIDLKLNITPTPTQIQQSNTVSVTGVGTLLNPYVLEVENPQKEIAVSSFPYTLSDNEDKHTIFLDNESQNVIVYVPENLKTGFTCSFIQKGTGDVVIIGNGLDATNVITPANLQNVIKGQAYGCFLEKEFNTPNYYLVGGLKLV